MKADVKPAVPDLRPSLPLYLAVGLVAGAVIALQICVMRIFSVGSWAHFGSLVVSLAMLAFGLVSAIMCIGKGFFARRWRGVAAVSLILFGPLMVAANLAAQQVPFNAIFLVSDPAQKWRLLANFLLYLLPFLAGALFLGTVFLKGDRIFARVYFADMVGAGLGGLVFLGMLFLIPPEDLIVVPLGLGCAGGLAWFVSLGRARSAATIAMLGCAVLAVAAHAWLPQTLGLRKLAVSATRASATPASSPTATGSTGPIRPSVTSKSTAAPTCISRPACRTMPPSNLPTMPATAYLGLYIDGEGPNGIIRNLPPEDTAYFGFLPMAYPYVIAEHPDTFVIQFGGGISTALALRKGSKSVTVSESNPAVLSAFRTDPALRDFTGDLIHDPRVTVVDYDRAALSCRPPRQL